MSDEIADFLSMTAKWFSRTSGVAEVGAELYVAGSGEEVASEGDDQDNNERAANDDN